MSRAARAVSTLNESVIRFQVRNGIHRISCVVSDEALEVASGLTAPLTEALRRKSFDRFRNLINAAAMLKLSGLPTGFAGPIVLTSQDLRRVPPETGTPPFGTTRNLTPPAPPTDDMPVPSEATSSKAVLFGPVS